jgi:hypothetical protein
MHVQAIMRCYRSYPAFSRAALIALCLNLGILLGLRIAFRDSRPSLFLMGDSGIGNYRLDPGQRLQDALGRLTPGMRVENWAEPGGTPLDYYLQWQRGALAAGRPRRVVVAMEHPKFLELTSAHRFDEDGVNLRWIPWNRSGRELFRMLSPRERNVAMVQQASVPFYGLADLGRLLWIRYVQWPKERAEMRAAGPGRWLKIEPKCADLGRAWDTLTVPDDSAFAALPRAVDGAFLFRALRESGIETRVLLIPFGNPDMMERTWSPQSIAKRDTVLARMRGWLEAQGVAYIDLNTPEELARFPDPVWDDLQHIKDPAAFAYMAERIAGSWTQPPTLSQEP